MEPSLLDELAQKLSGNTTAQPKSNAAPAPAPAAPFDKNLAKNLDAQTQEALDGVLKSAKALKEANADLKELQPNWNAEKQSLSAFENAAALTARPAFKNTDYTTAKDERNSAIEDIEYHWNQLLDTKGSLEAKAKKALQDAKLPTNIEAPLFTESKFTSFVQRLKAGC